MTISTSPTYPVVGETITLSSDALSGTDRVWILSSVPAESALTTGLLVTPTDEDQTGVVAALLAGTNVETFTPDVAGEYGVTVVDIRRDPGAPSFDGDPAGVRGVHILGTEEGTAHVGATSDLYIGTEAGDGATLRLTIVDETIRAATLVEPTTETARIAALQSSVTSPLAALVGVTVASAGTDLQTGVADLLTNYEAHRELTSGSVHVSADITNGVHAHGTGSQAAAIATLNLLHEALLGHLLTSTTEYNLGGNAPVGGSSNPWHTEDHDDGTNVPVAPAAQTLAQATVLSADLRERCYERHRVQIASPDTHGAADSTNTLAAPSKLDDLIVAYLDAIVATNPTAPTGEPEGIQDARHRYGFS